MANTNGLRDGPRSVPGVLDAAHRYRQALRRRKYEVAEELGIPLDRGDPGELTAREAGRLGGLVGGRIGGEMVRRLVRLAEEQMASRPRR